MQEPYGEGLANHTGPESCAVGREPIGNGDRKRGHSTFPEVQASRRVHQPWTETGTFYFVRRPGSRTGTSIAASRRVYPPLRDFRRGRTVQ